MTLRIHFAAIVALVLSLSPSLPSSVMAQEPADTNYDESLVPAYELPDPLVSFNGRVIQTADDWNAVRKPEIMQTFATQVYGRIPEFHCEPRFEVTAEDGRALDGLATRREIRIRWFEDEDAPWIDLLLFIPNGRSYPAPVFLGLNYGNQGVHEDPDIAPSRNSVCERGEHAHRWPLERLLKRGYAVATFHGGDVELDQHGSGCLYTSEGWERGIRSYIARQSSTAESANDTWGAISAWAWALSRAADYLRQDAQIAGDKIALVGHSRTGKAALWAGALDDRFGMIVSNNSGQGGAALARRRFGETVAASYSLSGSWYCKNYEQYGNNEAALAVDAHLLIAALAPRPVYVASAELDGWADPRGEFLAAKHAEPVYQLFGKIGIGSHINSDEMPAVNAPVGDAVGYHVRSGDYEITEYDWEQYMRFADRHFKIVQ